MTHLNSALLSRHASPSLLTSSQIALDGFLQNFSSNVTNPTVLLPMMAGTFAFQASRAALISAGMGRLFSSGLAWLAEVGVFHESGRLAARLAGHASSETHFLRTALDLGVFKLTGSALPRTNFITRNASQAFAMLGAEELAVSANLLERSSESFSSRYAHAFASSVQMEAGALLSGMALGGTLKSLERSLETVSVIRSTSTKPVRSLAGRNVLSMATGSTPYDPLTDPRDIPENIRINFKRFHQGVKGLKRYLERIEGGRLREPAPEIINGEGEVRDSLIPDVPRENEARQAFLIRFLGFASGRGSQFAIDQAENAVRFFNSPDPRVSQMGLLQILAIAEDTIRDYQDPSVERPYVLPTPPTAMIPTVGHVVQLAPDHPGFKDSAYRARRDIIARIARDYAPDTLSADRDYSDVPTAPYIPEEHAFWQEINRLLEPLHTQYACREYLEARRRLTVSTNEIPQLRDLNPRLRELTGFQMVPVEGLVTTEAFIGTLAKRIFLSTQYVRHHSRPGYTPEPDVSHEITGHAAFLSNPDIAELSRLFGEAILRARNPEEVTRLGNLYWHTIEYGVLMEDGVPKAYGAGHFGSSGELPEVARRRLLPFDLDLMQRTPYDPTRMQPFYFAAPSFSEMVQKLSNHLRLWPYNITAPVSLRGENINQMPRLIIGVTGKDASGKDSVLDMLAQQGFRTMSLSDALRAELTRQGKEPSRENCRLLANELRARDGASALARLALSQMEPGVNYAFGSIRNPAEVEALREAGNGNFHFIATTAPAAIRFERLRARGRLGDAHTLESFLAHEALEASNSDPNAQQMDRVIGMADRQIDNSGSYGEFQARVANYLRDLLKASQE